MPFRNIKVESFEFYVDVSFELLVIYETHMKTKHTRWMFKNDEIIYFEISYN